MRRFVLGDVHGRYEELIELLKKAGFDYEADQLISLGDLVDRGPEPFLCILELLKIKNFICVQGNHDIWLYNFILEGSREHFLKGEHGSRPTIDKWEFLDDESRLLVWKFLKQQVPYYVDKDNNLFVHAGIDREEKIENQLLWTLAAEPFFVDEIMAMQRNKNLKKVPTVDDFNEIYIGHMITLRYRKDSNGIFQQEKSWIDVVMEPINILNVWMMDTGAGYTQGRLSLMNIDTKELFQVETK
jgi:serine/threonine protein phosphatase 1